MGTSQQKSGFKGLRSNPDNRAKLEKHLSPIVAINRFLDCKKTLFERPDALIYYETSLGQHDEVDYALL